jgi:molybdate transport system substrate-binding protein
LFQKATHVFTLLLFCAFFLAMPALAAEELTVFAAASMTESMNQIAELYQKEAPGVKLVYNFDSSGTLKTQIEQGADCDFFISAGQKQMDALGEKFVKGGTRFNVVANEVVLVVPKGVNPNKISDFKDAGTDKVKLMALGNSDVPVGQYAEEIYKYLGLWDRLNVEKKISFASNVKEVLSQVASGAVDCGVVYGTDAATSKAVEVVANAPAGSHKPIVYPAAVMKNTKHAAAAEAFAAFLKGPQAEAVFKSVGFAIPQK